MTRTVEASAYCELHGVNLVQNEHCALCAQGTGRLPERLNVLNIHSVASDIAPASHRWSAMLNEYDLGTKVFSGPTQREAINELLDYYEQGNGELHA